MNIRYTLKNKFQTANEYLKHRVNAPFGYEIAISFLKDEVKALAVIEDNRGEKNIVNNHAYMNLILIF